MRDTSLIISTEKLSPVFYESIECITCVHGFSQQNIARCDGFVIMEDDRVVGFITFMRLNDFCYNIERLFVLPEYRKKRLGSYLYSLCEDRVKELARSKSVFRKPTMFLESAVKASGFWGKMGFESWGLPVFGTMRKEFLK